MTKRNDSVKLILIEANKTMIDCDVHVKVASQLASHSSEKFMQTLQLGTTAKVETKHCQQ